MRFLLLCSIVLCLADVPAFAQTGLIVTLTDAKATLSRATVGSGPLTVTVVNRGKGTRWFVLAGAHTPAIPSGGKATLRISLAPGKVAFTATGKPKTLRGTVSAIAVVAAGGTTTTPQSSQTNVLASCARQVATTVSVTLDDGKFTFSPAAAPCGTVTFALTNVGKNNHSLYLESSGVQSGALGPGQSEKLTVQLAPGSVTWVDGVYETDLGGDAGTYTING